MHSWWELQTLGNRTLLKCRRSMEMIPFLTFSLSEFSTESIRDCLLRFTLVFSCELLVKIGIKPLAFVSVYRLIGDIFILLIKNKPFCKPNSIIICKAKLVSKNVENKCINKQTSLEVNDA